MIQDQALVASKHLLIETEDTTVKPLSNRILPKSNQILVQEYYEDKQVVGSFKIIQNK